MKHRRKNRAYRLPVGAATAAAAIAVGGTLWIWPGGPGTSDDNSRTTQAVAPDPRIDCARKGQVPGSGSTAQQNAMTYWINQYQRACPGVQIAYNPRGSTGGVTEFMLGTTAFSGTDDALKPEDIAHSRSICRGGHAIDLPIVGGPIAIGYHLVGVDDLVLDARTLAKIFNSEIKKWNDPAIRKLNPGAELPDLAIQPVHRSDGSGTTQNFTAYLAATAPHQWRHPVSEMWPGRGGHSAAGSANVTRVVAGIPGAIGYVELSFAAKDKIPTVRIDTGAPEPVAPSPQTASAGIATARVVGKGNDLALELDYAIRNAGAYPIVLITYEIVCDKGNQPETLPALKSFLAYTAGEAGQEILPDINYAPLPSNIATRVREVIPTLS